MPRFVREAHTVELRPGKTAHVGALQREGESGQQNIDIYRIKLGETRGGKAERIKWQVAYSV